MGCVVSFTAQLLPSGRGPSVPIEKKAGWVPKLVWMFWRRDTFLPLLESNYDFSDVCLVTVSPPPSGFSTDKTVYLSTVPLTVSVRRAMFGKFIVMCT